MGKYQMSRLYGPVHRSLQDRFDTRRLADNVEARVVLTEIPPEHKAFIETRDMFFSMGNLLGNQQVGMLLINFEKPHRLRLQGIASVDDNDPLLSEYAEAQLIVRVG